MASIFLASQATACFIDRPSSRKNNFTRVKSLFSSDLKPLKKQFEHHLGQFPRHIDGSKVIKDVSVSMCDAIVELMFKFVKQPLLPSQRNFAPVDEIHGPVGIDSIDGEIPDDFPDGVYIRVGSNPLYGGLKTAVSIFGQSSETWVEGEGMFHAVYFKKDDCSGLNSSSSSSWTISYNNKYVESETFKVEKQRNKPAFIPALEGDPPAILAAYVLNMLRFGMVNKEMGNTNVFEHSGKFYAISENHLPQEFDISSLRTLGRWDVNGGWGRPFTSHPKKAPGTGELVTVGVDLLKPYVELGVISADGKKVHKVDLEFGRSPLCHEIGITNRFNVIFDFPLTFDIGRVLKGGTLMKYESHKYARIGVMPRYGDAQSIKWFEVEPCCMFHIINSFEDGDEVIIWGCSSRGSIIPGPEKGVNKLEWFSRGFKPSNLLEDEESKNQQKQEGLFFSRCHEWRLNLKTGKVNKSFLSGTQFSLEFPFINEELRGTKSKYCYAQVVDCLASSISGMGKYGGLAKIRFEETDDRSYNEGESSREQFKKIEYHMFEENTYCTGASFVPKKGSVEEDDGWIITYVHNESTDVSQVYIVDAKNFSADPIVKITLPCRVPYGFHGAYVQITSPSL